jgi:hypothetical protein
LDEHPAMAKEIEGKIYAALGLGKDLLTPITHSGTGERDKDAVVAAAQPVVVAKPLDGPATPQPAAARAA